MKYVVEEGDTLWGISQRYLKTGTKWRKIYSYNYHIIGDNPDLIEPGMILTIPKYRTTLACLKREVSHLQFKTYGPERDRYINRIMRVQDEMMSHYTFRIVLVGVILIIALAVKFWGRW